MYKQYIAPIGITVLMLFLLGITILYVFYGTRQAVGDVIVQDIKNLKVIFERIHEDCTIIDFDFQKNPINFLNVKQFVGSEVGPMNLMHPEQWKGPYIDDNPTVQAIEYQVVRTKDGYFITPGDGVTLPNGKVVGKDILLDVNTDIRKMMLDKNALMFNGKSLATPVEFKVPDELLELVHP